MEKGLTQCPEDIIVPTPHISVTVDMAQTSVHGGYGSRWASGGVTTDERGMFNFKTGDRESDREDESSCASEERKAEESV